MSEPIVLYQIQRQSNERKSIHGGRGKPAWIDIPIMRSQDIDKVADLARCISANLGPMPLRIIRQSLTPPYLGNGEVIWDSIDKVFPGAKS